MTVTDITRARAVEGTRELAEKMAQPDPIPTGRVRVGDRTYPNSYAPAGRVIEIDYGRAV